MSCAVIDQDLSDLDEILLTARKIPGYIWKKQRYRGT